MWSILDKGMIRKIVCYVTKLHNLPSQYNSKTVWHPVPQVQYGQVILLNMGRLLVLENSNFYAAFMDSFSKASIHVKSDEAC